MLKLWRDDAWDDYLYWQDALNKFEGVDIDSLKGEIETLKSDLATKEQDFNTQLADRDFQAAVTSEIQTAKGRNPKAIMALLDTEVLKCSNNLDITGRF